MKKYPIGFNAMITEDTETEKAVLPSHEACVPKKSVVQVYFPHRGMSWAYYNDSFDLKVGDFVYVEGKLEGYRGQVTEVCYSFKIKLSDYKKVIAVIDTNITGDFHIVMSHIISFDKSAIPFSKILPWFKAPEGEAEYAVGSDAENNFFLDDLSTMKISPDVANRGHDYYTKNKVVFLEIDDTRGHAIVEGSENYEVEFDYADDEISNLTCSCFCSGCCKHEFAVMLQLKETLDIITENYENEKGNYFAAISRGVFMNTVMNKKASGKISLGV